MEQFFETLPSLASQYALALLGSIAIFIIGRWVARLLINAVKKTLRRANVDETLISFLNNVLYYVLLVVVIVAALSNLGIPTTSIVAILGGATLAVGLALQDSLGNLAAGVMIILLRPYRVGDFVGINDEEGEVTEIKIFHTQIQTPANKIVFVPNNEVISGNITNYTKKGLYRYDMAFGIGYEDDLLKAKDLLLEILEAHDDVEQDPAPSVIVGELGDSSVNLVARPWIDYRRRVPIGAAITEQVKLRFDEAGISIPFPQRDVHLFQST